MGGKLLPYRRIPINMKEMHFMMRQTPTHECEDKQKFEEQWEFEKEKKCSFIGN